MQIRVLFPQANSKSPSPPKEIQKYPFPHSVSSVIIFSLPDDLGASTVGRSLPWGHNHLDLLRGGAPRQPQLLGEGRGDDPRQRALRVHTREGLACLQGGHVY